MNPEEIPLHLIVESILLSANEPMDEKRLLEVVNGELPVFTLDEIRKALALLVENYQNRSFELKKIASGYRFQVLPDYAHWVRRLWHEKPPRYSKAILETIALIAYRQPITRAEIEEVRGVAVSSHIIKTLLERQWVRVCGHKEVPGRPALYATTRQFLDYFNLTSLTELPTLNDLQDLESAETMLAQQLELEGFSSNKEIIEVKVVSQEDQPVE